MRQLLPSRWRRAREHEDQVAGTLACMIGGVILARAVSGKESEALLQACRRFLHRTLDERGSAPERGRIRPSTDGAMWQITYGRLMVPLLEPAAVT